MAAAKPAPVPGYPPNHASISNPSIPNGLELLQAHVYFRHGERTPVKQRLTHLGIPDRWNLCTAGKEFAAGVINDPEASTSSQSLGKRKKANSELMLIRKQVEVAGRQAEPSECAWGELTDLGRLSTLRLGKQLRARYVDNLGFLPKIITEADADTVYMRSTGVPRAFESMQQVLHGIYPAQDASHVPTIATRAFEDESLLPTSGCPTAKAMDLQYKKASAEKYNHLLEPLDSKLAELVGVPVRIDSHPSCNGIFDTIKAAQAHSLPVPEVFKDRTVSDTMEKAIVHEWFSAYASRQYTRLVMGRLFAEMNTKMEERLSGKSGLKLGLYGCHDTSLAGILHGLRAFDNKWPAFTAYISVELFKKQQATESSKGWLASRFGGELPSDKEHYVRVRYDDRDVQIPACAPAGKHLEGSNGAICTFEAFKEAVEDISLTKEEWSKASPLLDFTYRKQAYQALLLQFREFDSYSQEAARSEERFLKAEEADRLVMRLTLLTVALQAAWLPSNRKTGTRTKKSLAMPSRKAEMTAANASEKRAESPNSQEDKAGIMQNRRELYNTEAPQYAGELEMDEKEKNRILRKIDWAIVPYSALLYLLSFLDRVNIGQARVAGLLTDLKMSNNQYQIALTVFFVSYVAVEVPSNLALKVLTPQVWISINVILWSICTICLGLCETPGQLIAVRFLLGLFEGGLFPGLNFVFSLYYTREELGKRVAIFFAGATLAGAFGGLLAFGIRQMAGVGGRGGWAWIFILEGLLTFVCSIPAYWLIQDFPARAKLFVGNEREKWMHHLSKSQGVTSAETPFTWIQVKRGLKDWHCWAYAMLYLSIATPFYCLSLFLPTIIAGLGFKNAQANALSTPPYVLGFITTLLACWYSDKIQRRGIILIGCMSLCAIGYIILLAQYTPGVSYMATFFCVAGVSPSIALAIVWVGQQFGPVTLRAAVLGVFFSFGNSAGIISSNVYPARTSPRFFQGHGIALGFAVLTIIIATILIIDHERENARRDALYGPVPKGLNPLHADQALLEKWGLSGMTREQILDLGDKHPGHRYML